MVPSVKIFFQFTSTFFALFVIFFYLLRVKSLHKPWGKSKMIITQDACFQYTLSQKLSATLLLLWLSLEKKPIPFFIIFKHGRKRDFKNVLTVFFSLLLINGIGKRTSFQFFITFEWVCGEILCTFVQYRQ